MSIRFGTRGTDARLAREAAAALGADHGRRALGEARARTVARLYHAAQRSQSRTAAMLAWAEHLARRRPRDDARLSRRAGRTLRLSAQVADRRARYGEALARSERAQRAADDAPDRPWPLWLRVPLILLMATGGALNLAGGLVSVSSDDRFFALAYAGATGVALVAIGAAIGHMLKGRQVDAADAARGRAPDRSRIPAAMVALGAAAAAALVVAVAGIRVTGARADAARAAVAARPVVIPVLDGGLDGGSPVDPVDPVEVLEPALDAAEPVPTVPVWVWALLEGVLVAGALLVEYAGHSPSAREAAVSGRRAAKGRRRWRRDQRRLARSWASTRAAWDHRASHDAAIAVAGDATVGFTGAEAATYRYEMLVRQRVDAAGAAGGVARGVAGTVASGSTATADRPRAATVDGVAAGAEPGGLRPLGRYEQRHRPGRGIDPGGAARRLLPGPERLDRRMRRRWGLDLRPLGWVAAGDDSGVTEHDDAVARILRRAEEELAEVPARPVPPLAGEPGRPRREIGPRDVDAAGLALRAFGGAEQPRPGWQAERVGEITPPGRVPGVGAPGDRP